MKKNLYFAPAVEQIEVRFEENILSVKTPTGPGKMDTTSHSASEWGDWQ